MKLLLDTHVLIWGLLQPARLSRRAARALANPANELWISPISTWEILILGQKGRIDLRPDPQTWTADALVKGAFREAPLTHDVALATASIQLPHRDPADFFLAATARVLNLTLVTADEHLLAGSGYHTLPAR